MHGVDRNFSRDLLKRPSRAVNAASLRVTLFPPSSSQRFFPQQRHGFLTASSSRRPNNTSPRHQLRPLPGTRASQQTPCARARTRLVHVHNAPLFVLGVARADDVDVAALTPHALAAGAHFLHGAADFHAAGGGGEGGGVGAPKGGAEERGRKAGGEGLAGGEEGGEAAEEEEHGGGGGGGGDGR